jgi:hypothetical protein
LFRKEDEKEDWFILNDRNQLICSGEEMVKGKKMLAQLGNR